MVGTYAHHALIIVNYGTEKGQDIVDFMHGIQQEVKQQFGIMLEPEVWIYLKKLCHHLLSKADTASGETLPPREQKTKRCR